METYIALFIFLEFRKVGDGVKNWDQLNIKVYFKNWWHGEWMGQKGQEKLVTSFMNDP